MKNPETAELAPADRAMADFAWKLTRRPESMEEADVARLRGQGFTDEAVLDIVQVTAYYNYVNRLTNGLGVELEGYWGKSE